jgi:hypothetical protein
VLTNPVAAPKRDLPASQPVAIDAGVHITPEWRIEKDPSSSGSVSIRPGDAVAVSYVLGGGERASQFVALAGDLAGRVPAWQIVFSGEAGQPMRLSVQLRFPETDRRWVKSVYLDGIRRTVAIPVGEMLAAERDGALMPDPATARSILFVVDLTNAVPGSRGSFTVRDVRLIRRPG